MRPGLRAAEWMALVGSNSSSRLWTGACLGSLMETDKKPGQSYLPMPRVYMDPSKCYLLVAIA